MTLIINDISAYIVFWLGGMLFAFGCVGLKEFLKEDE